MELVSQMWSLLGLMTVLQNVLPSQLLHLLHSLWQSLQDSLTPFSYFDVPEFIGYCTVDPNDLYRHVHLYVNSVLCCSSSSSSSSGSGGGGCGGSRQNNSSSTTTTTTTLLPRLTLSLPRNSPNLSLTIAPNHSIEDHYLDHHRVLWTHHVDTLQDSLEERRSFSLRVPKTMVSRSADALRAYLAHVSARASDFERHSRERRLHTNLHAESSSSTGGGCWASVPFRHPATFDTLALDPDLKTKIISDLDAFARGKPFYSRVGRAWKRGYLLHGPPGSGKSTLIAAMANHLRYDVFDLELTKVSDNGELRALLIQTTNRSIIVIEDIDCSLDLTGDRLWANKSNNNNEKEDEDEEKEDQENDGRVTLSGLLNFTDGLWSCCGEERIIVFTTNHREGLDPALLRAGRMDVHIRLGECGVHAFRELVRSYLGLVNHELLHVAESCIREGAALTPAEVGEVLLRNREDADVAMREVVQELQGRLLLLLEKASDSDGSDDSHSRGKTSSTKRRTMRRKKNTATTATMTAKEGGGRRPSKASWEKRVKFLTRLRSLTKSDSGGRGI